MIFRHWHPISHISPIPQVDCLYEKLLSGYSLTLFSLYLLAYVTRVALCVPTAQLRNENSDAVDSRSFKQLSLLPASQATPPVTIPGSAKFTPNGSSFSISWQSPPVTFTGVPVSTQSIARWAKANVHLENKLWNSHEKDGSPCPKALLHFDSSLSWGCISRLALNSI